MQYTLQPKFHKYISNKIITIQSPNYFIGIITHLKLCVIIIEATTCSIMFFYIVYCRRLEAKESYLSLR